GEVLASDFKIPSQVEILTPNAHIATLDGEASELEIHLRLDRGKGFVLSEDIQSIFDITTIGWIPLDADFSPVKKVAYKVEDTRVGEKTDYNKLTMEIWTDGSLMPSQAVTKAADILIDHFSMIRENLGKVNVSKVTKAVNVKADVLEKSLKDMGIKERTLKVLSDAGIKTVGNLLKLSKDDLASIKGFGKKSMSDIEKLLDSLGLELSGGKK
ncbi:MAG: DNA-directed RNA polymerase subunit alpha, partial [Nitrospiraceae bacterium]|nr:DNA-directed RNA polymerase subunit alpha [Nitrospiraceae bacterium]